MNVDLLPIPIFPPASLDSSVTTTVWIGVIVVAFFNLRLGWIFSGLVVPGYLVPLIIARPISAAVIVVEAVLVYLIARVVSDLSPRSAAWSSLFGRDRFFFLVVVSVIVRLVLDGSALPRVAALLEQRYQWNLDLSNELHSFGLVIVALLANLLWKPGLFAGLLQATTTTIITYFVVRVGLMELTNFNLGALEYMYEDIAASILASPKAYIILLTTAFFASRLNLLYGWEYSGVLIPALLALQWYQPSKLIASIVEAWAVLGVSTWLLQSRFFQGSTVEKASKLALFFTVSYVYKYVMAFALLVVAPEVKVSDLYGFGYLLPSLLAVKMHEKNIGLRMTRFTLQTTVVSAVVALLVGFFLTLVPRPRVEAEVFAEDGGERRIETSQGPLAGAWLRARVSLNASRADGGYQSPTATDLAQFNDAMGRLITYAAEPDDGDWQPAVAGLTALGFVVERVDDAHLLVREVEPRGGGIFLLRLGGASGLAFTAPRPLEEWATARAALGLYELFAARGVAVAGGPGFGISDATRRADTYFQVFHRLVSNLSVVQLRGLEEETPLPVSQDAAAEAARRVATAAAVESVLRVKRELPPDLDLRRLEEMIGSYAIEWGRVAAPSLQWRTSRVGVTELRLTRSSRHALLLSPAEDVEPPRPEPYEQPIEGYLHRWLLTGKGRIAERGSEVYVPPDLADMIFFDEEVVSPIVQLARFEYADGHLSERGRRAWRRAALAAALYDYQTIWYRHSPSGRDYLILQESDPGRRFWGTYVFRLGEASPFLVNVPRPRVERRTFEVGVSLFERLEAGTLTIAGTHPYANGDASSDLIRIENKVNLFNLVNQAVLRTAGEAPHFVVLCRAFASTGDPEEPQAMIASYGGARSAAELGPLGGDLLATLRQDGIEPRLVDGSPVTAGYEVGGSPQVRYLDQTINKQLAVLWLSEATRETFRLEGEEILRDSPLRALGIESLEDDIASRIGRAVAAPVGETGRARVADMLGHYVETADIMALRRLRAEQPGWRLERVVDRNSPRAFLLVFDGVDRFVAAVNLQLRERGEPLLVTDGDLRTAALTFLRQRRAVLVAGGGAT